MKDFIKVLSVLFFELGYEGIGYKIMDLDYEDKEKVKEVVNFLDDIKRNIFGFKLYKNSAEEEEGSPNQIKDVKIKLKDYYISYLQIKSIKVGENDKGKLRFYILLNQNPSGSMHYSNMYFRYPTREARDYDLDLLKIKLDLLNIKIL